MYSTVFPARFFLLSALFFGTFSAARAQSGAPMSPTEGDHTLALGDDAYAVKEMRVKISALEKQLAESEGAKAKAEMTLTERLARPLSQTEAQVSLFIRSDVTIQILL